MKGPAEGDKVLGGNRGQIFQTSQAFVKIATFTSTVTLTLSEMGRVKRLELRVRLTFQRLNLDILRIQGRAEKLGDQKEDLC